MRGNQGTSTFNFNGGTTLTSGFFANAPAGGIYTDAAGNMFVVSYNAVADGDQVANDVTLTVVPEPD